jgi:DNA-directed RNA polymerase subunit RPC12/RpoP
VTAALVSEATCIACNVKRIVKGVTSVARGYVMQSLECPQCSELFRIVVRHRRSHASYRAAFVDSVDFRANRN